MIIKFIKITKMLLLFLLFFSLKAQDEIKWELVTIKLTPFSDQAHYFMKHLKQINEIIPFKYNHKGAIAPIMEFKLQLPYKGGKLCSDCDNDNPALKFPNKIDVNDFNQIRLYDYLFSSMKIDPSRIIKPNEGEVIFISGAAKLKKSISKNLQDLDANRHPRFKKSFPIYDNSCEVYFRNHFNFRIFPIKVPINYKTLISKEKKVFYAYYIFEHSSSFPKNVEERAW